jgi:hypothetical protein
MTLAKRKTLGKQSREKMAALQSFSLMHLLRAVSPSLDGSKRAREFAERAHKQTNGATPDLKRVYGAYLDRVEAAH